MTGPSGEETVRLSGERCRALAAAIADIVWTADSSGQVIEDQAGWRAFTGQTSEQIKGAGWLAAVHPDSRDEAVTAWFNAAARGSLYETEWRLRRRDGEYRYFSIRAAPVRDSSGGIREWIGCSIDISDRKQCYEEQRRTHAEAVAALAQLKRQARDMQILKNLSDTLQACNSREEAFPFIALAATELFPGARGAVAVPAADVRDMLESAIEWGGDSADKETWMKADFALEDCWALRRGGLHEPGAGTVCQHFRTGIEGPHACVPLAVRGEVLGLLSMRFPETPRLDEERRAALSTFGNAIALGLSTLRLREALQGNPPSAIR